MEKRLEFLDNMEFIKDASAEELILFKKGLIVFKKELLTSNGLEGKKFISQKIEEIEKSLFHIQYCMLNMIRLYRSSQKTDCVLILKNLDIQALSLVQADELVKKIEKIKKEKGNKSQINFLEKLQKEMKTFIKKTRFHHSVG